MYMLLVWNSVLFSCTLMNIHITSVKKQKYNSYCMFVDANEGPMTANEDDTIVYFSSLNSCYLVNLQVWREQGASVSCFTSGNLSGPYRICGTDGCIFPPLCAFLSCIIL